MRTDQGKELGKLAVFQKMLTEEGFILELTGTDTSAQNAIAESVVDLGPKYWSFVLIHAVFIKIRVPHSFIKKTRCALCISPMALKQLIGISSGG